MDIREAALELWRFHCVYDDLRRSDVIIGLGSYDIRVAEHCAALFHAGLADRIVFTGSSGNWTQKLFPEGEAVAFRDVAKAKGVNDNAIIVEPRATNIGENIQFSAELLCEVKRVIFVTKPQTQLRCKTTAQKQWSRVTGLLTAPCTTFAAQPLPHHDEDALICEMVGDLERILEYAKRGFQTEVDVPRRVRRAYDVLVSSGFTTHLQKRPFHK